MSRKQPMQPIVWDDRGNIRFQGNKIVQWLVDQKKIDLNAIFVAGIEQQWPIPDLEQFWQMLGYSVSGFGDLSFVRRETVNKADEIADRMLKRRDKT